MENNNDTGTGIATQPLRVVTDEDVRRVLAECAVAVGSGIRAYAKENNIEVQFMFEEDAITEWTKKRSKSIKTALEHSEKGWEEDRGIVLQVAEEFGKKVAEFARKNYGPDAPDTIIINEDNVNEASAFIRDHNVKCRVAGRGRYCQD